MAHVNKPPRTLADRDEELYTYLCRLVDDINASNSRDNDEYTYTEEDI